MVVVVVVVVVVVFQISFACWKIYCTRTLNVVNNQQKKENQRLVRALVKHLFRVFVCCWLHFVLCIVLSGCWLDYFWNVVISVTLFHMIAKTHSVQLNYW